MEGMVEKADGVRRMDRCICCVHLVDILPGGKTGHGWSIGTCELSGRMRRAQSPACGRFVEDGEDTDDQV